MKEKVSRVRIVFVSVTTVILAEMWLEKIWRKWVLREKPHSKKVFKPLRAETTCVLRERNRDTWEVWMMGREANSIEILVKAGLETWMLGEPFVYERPLCAFFPKRAVEVIEE
ncbi:MAG: hypothetical protein HQ538_02770 [Parcubacteria group bacterium]|nr:hypothetical protein [Parcubacteria group bacterium]